ncbi:MAG: SCP2 sterol-binding domain-containing protein [Candidatus Helarchaeota archaeon]
MSTAEDGFELVKKKFIPEKAKDVKKLIVQYIIEGDGGGKWYAVVENQKISIFEGTADKAQATMTFVNVNAFLKMIKGEIDGIQGFTMGLVKPEGPRAVLELYASILGLM